VKSVASQPNQSRLDSLEMDCRTSTGESAGWMPTGGTTRPSNCASPPRSDARAGPSASWGKGARGRRRRSDRVAPRGRDLRRSQAPVVGGALPRRPALEHPADGARAASPGPANRRRPRRASGVARGPQLQGRARRCGLRLPSSDQERQPGAAHRQVLRAVTGAPPRPALALAPAEPPAQAPGRGPWAPDASDRRPTGEGGRLARRGNRAGPEDLEEPVEVLAAVLPNYPPRGSILPATAVVRQHADNPP